MILFIIGLLSGLISGMGIGGGTVLIPALTLFVGMSQHNAQSINLIYFIQRHCSLVIHIRKKNRKELLIFNWRRRHRCGDRPFLAVSLDAVFLQLFEFSFYMGIKEIRKIKGKLR